MVEAAKREEAGWARALAEAPPAGSEATVPDAALGALLDDADATDGDAELWVRRLGERVGRLDALNVGGMLAAATEGGGAGARLSARLDAGGAAAAALATRLARLDALARAAPAALHARSGAARADAAARALLQELTEIYAWLDAPPLRDLDSISEISLASPEGRARALAAGAALRSALRAERGMAPARRRLGAVRERLRRLQRAKDALAAALARHLNNLLIHLGNEAASAPAAATSNTAAAAAAARAHHADLLPYAPFMRWLKDMDEKAYDALTKVYVGTWSRVYEREARAACDAARAVPAPAHAATADTPLDAVLTVVENICNAEQDFCTQFFFLDVDVKSDGSDGERSETSEEVGARRGGGAEARRMMQELFPALEAELVALVNHLERQPYGAMRALACVSTRVLGDGATATPTGASGGVGGGSGSGGGGGGGGGEGRWARTALAAVAVAAKRGADRVIADRLAAMPESARQAAKRPKAGLLGFLAEFEELSTVCEAIFGARGRRADLERWYGALGGAMLAAVAAAEHPRTPRPVLRLENYHKLHALLAARRAATLDALRREARARYAEALRQYVTHYFGRPLDKLTQFFEGVAEAVAGGAREEEVCYRAAFSKHELRRLLALYPAPEVRRSLHRLYRTVEKHLSEEGGLLQVVWRAMQEEFLAQHQALQVTYSKHELRRLLALYPAPEVRRSLHRLYRTVEKHLSEEGGLLQVVWRAMQEEFLAQHQALQVTYSKHELRRLLALYPAPEVRRSLHRLYRTVEKHLSEEGGLLQVVWRAMQEEFLAQHQALQVTYSKHELRRLLALYPAPEVRRSLHRLYRTVEKHLSEEGGLLQVVWRAMQEEFLAQHQALQVTYSKHELRRLLALYPAPEVRRSLHRLYRTVEKHLSEEGGLLQVVWRAMQEEFLAQHQALQVTYSKHELRRLLALYPAPEVRRSLHRLYRTVEKHLSEEGGLLQVVWRAMQEEFLAQHQALQVTYSKHELRRLLALYPAPEVRRSLHRLYRTVEKHLSEEGGLLQVVWRAMQEEFLAQHQALQVTYSKHELRRLLALYPAPEVRRSLHRLYRTVEKHLSEEGGLLQVVWRAMQEEFLAQHQALQARIAACYPGAGLALPLTTQDILDAFSDIAREH